MLYGRLRQARDDACRTLHLAKSDHVWTLSATTSSSLRARVREAQRGNQHSRQGRLNARIVTGELREHVRGGLLGELGAGPLAARGAPEEGDEGKQRARRCDRGLVRGVPVRQAPQCTGRGLLRDAAYRYGGATAFVVHSCRHVQVAVAGSVQTVGTLELCDEEADGARGGNGCLVLRIAACKLGERVGSVSPDLFAPIDCMQWLDGREQHDERLDASAGLEDDLIRAVAAHQGCQRPNHRHQLRADAGQSRIRGRAVALD